MSLRWASTIAPMSMPGTLNFSTSLPRSPNDGRPPDFAAVFVGASLLSAGLLAALVAAGLVDVVLPAAFLVVTIAVSSGLCRTDKERIEKVGSAMRGQGRMALAARVARGAFGGSTAFCAEIGRAHV